MRQAAQKALASGECKTGDAGGGEDSSSSSSSSGSSSSDDSDSEGGEDVDTVGALRPAAGAASDSDEGDWDFESKALTAEQVRAALEAGAQAEASQQHR